MSEQEDFGCAGLVIAHDLFKAWQYYQQDGDRPGLQRRIAPLQAKLHLELEHASREAARAGGRIASRKRFDPEAPPCGSQKLDLSVELERRRRRLPRERGSSG
jgi:hypothetical protein